MAQLHELLAVEKDLNNVEKKLRAESVKTLGKESLFMGQVRSLTMFDDDRQQENFTEQQELTTTVQENLRYYQERATQAWDVTFHKDLANGNATADIIIDGVALVTEVPATTLLAMETKLAEVRALYEKIPTLAPGVKWIPDTQAQKQGVYTSANPVTSFKTEKMVEGVELSPATKEHPAQVQAVTVAKNIGKYETNVYSGMMSPATKAAHIENIDKLIRAVKKARMRANTQQVNQDKTLEALWGFINKV